MEILHIYNLKKTGPWEKYPADKCIKQYNYKSNCQNRTINFGYGVQVSGTVVWCFSPSLEIFCLQYKNLFYFTYSCNTQIKTWTRIKS